MNWAGSKYSRLVTAKIKQTVFFACLLAVSWNYAQDDPIVRSQVDTTEIRIGEQIMYTIQVETDSTSTVFFPEGQTFSPLETVEAFLTDTTRAKDRMTLERTYALTQFDSGNYLIPQQRIEIDGQGFFTDSVQVAVGTVAVDTTVQKMYDIKPLIEVERNYAGLWKTIFWVLLALAAIAAIVYFFFFRKKKLSEEEQEALLPAYDRALLELKRLENSKYLIQDEYKKYYSELTAIVRSYLEEDAHISALESTTSQLIDKLELLKDAGELKLKKETIQQFQKILQTADLVKFARSKPATSQAEFDRKAVEQIVIRTHAALPEPTEEELLQQQEYLDELARKQRKRKIVQLAAATLLLIIGTTAGLMAYYGPKYVWDTVTGHPTKKLLEGEWVKSTYGFPPIIVETPEVLVREEADIPAEIKAEIKELHSFYYQTDKGLFTIGASSKAMLKPEETDFQQSLEELLLEIESKGARNIITKEEEFTTASGTKGLKIFGSGSFPEANSNNRVKGKYAILIFGGNGFQQQLMLSWADDDPYAQEIVDRILNSLEVKTQV